MVEGTASKELSFQMRQKVALLRTEQNIQSMCSKNQEKDYQTKIASNIDNYRTELLEHDHKGVDTLMILRHDTIKTLMTR